MFCTLRTICVLLSIALIFNAEISAQQNCYESCAAECIAKKLGDNNVCNTYCDAKCKTLPPLPPPQLSPLLPEPAAATVATNMPVTAPLHAPPQASAGECPPKWEDRNGACYDPTGSPCNGMKFSGMTSEQKSAAAVYCGISVWAEANPCPDGWIFNNDTGQCSAPGVLPCSPVTFYGNVSYKTITDLENWSKTCSAPWAGINYSKGETPREMSLVQCPDGWAQMADGSCKIIATTPQTTCSGNSNGTNWQTLTDDQKWNWATMCGWPWGRYGLPYPCPIGFNKISGPDQYNGCVRQGPVPTGVNMASKYYKMTNECKQIDVNGWNRQSVKQLAKDCKLEWPGINIPDPRYPNNPY